MSAPEALRLEDVSKSYGGVVALDGLSMVVPSGSICGLIGPNGSGKTTAMAVVSGLVRADAGQVDVLGGGPFRGGDPKRCVGLLPQDCQPPRQSAIAVSLEHLCQLQGASASAAKTEVEHWLDRLGLQNKRGASYGELSHGMRRRFGIIQAMMGGPQLVLLDEPTAGLDPDLAATVRECIARKKEDCTVVVSSHVLSELESLCDFFVMIDSGRCVRSGTMRSLRQASGDARLVLAGVPDLVQLKLGLPGYRFEWDAPGLSVHPYEEQAPEVTNQDVLGWLLANGIGILSVSSGESLESAYLGRSGASSEPAGD